MVGTVVGSIAGGFASSAASKLFGGSSGGGGSRGSSGPTLYPFSGGGIRGSFGPGGVFNVTNTKARQALVDAISKGYLNNATALRSTYMPQFQDALSGYTGNLDNLLAQVKPGYGALTDALVTAIQNAGSSAGSDLRSSLAKRRVLGSSFGDAAISSQALDVAQQVGQAKAQGLLAEMDATNQFLTQKYDAQAAGIDQLRKMADAAFTYEEASSQTQLDEQNRLASLADGLIQTASSLNAQNQQIEAQLNAKAAAGAGSYFAPFATSVGNTVSNFFSGLGGSSGGSSGSGGYFINPSALQ